jgi:spore maturation protein CgeB
VEHLFRPNDFRVARDGDEMERELTRALDAPRNGALELIRSRHTCAHRADELLAIAAPLEEAAVAAA